MFIEEFCIARFRWDVYLAINYELLFHITYVKIVSDVHCRLRAFEYQYHSVFIGEFRILCPFYEFLTLRNNLKEVNINYSIGKNFQMRRTVWEVSHTVLSHLLWNIQCTYRDSCHK